MSIQVLKPKFHVEECLQQIRECLEIGWTGMGFKTVEFEDAWKTYTGHGNAHFLNSATAGLHLAMQILKDQGEWDDGDEVITSPCTFISTSHAISYANLKPRFADVDEYLCLDPVEVEKKITSKTKAVIFVGYGGRVGQLDEVVKICKKYDLRLILDAAHMAGTRVHGVFPGTWEDIDVTIYSFQAVKNLPTADSGMICFRNEELDGIARKYAWLGINKDTYARVSSQGAYKWDYDVEHVGYKYHGNSIIAAIGLVQLNYLDEDNAYRRKLVSLYDELLKPNINVSPIPIPYSDECSCHIYTIRVDDRNALLQELAKNDIYGGVHYRDNTEYDIYAYDHGSCPKSHEITKNIMSLPLNLNITPEMIREIVEIVNKFTFCRAE